MTDPYRSWATRSLKAVTQEVSNIDPTHTPEEVFTYVDISAIDNERHIISNARRLPGSAVPSRARRAIQEGDILFANVRPYLKNIAQVTNLQQPTVASTGFTVLRPTAEINGRYLFHLVRSNYFLSLVSSGQTGSHYPATSDRRVRAIEVAIPPLDLQHRYADLLDRVETTRQEVLAALDNAESSVDETVRTITMEACSGDLTSQWRRERKSSGSPSASELPADDISNRPGPPNPDTLFSDLLPVTPDYRWSDLRTLALGIDYGTSRRTTPVRSGVIVLRMGNIQDGEIDWNDLRYLPASEVPDSLMLDTGDLLFNRTNGSPDLVGKSAVFLSKRQATFASYLIRVRLKRDIVHPDWVCTWLNSPYGREWALAVRSVGVSQSNISGTKLAAMRLPVPEYGEQEEILRRVRRVRQAAEAIRDRTDLARIEVENLSNMLLDRLVAGPRYGAGSADQTEETIAVEPIRLPWVNKIDGRRPEMAALEENTARTLLEIVQEAGGRMDPGQLWHLSAFADDVDQFYAYLRQAVEEGYLIEERQGHDTLPTIVARS